MRLKEAIRQGLLVTQEELRDVLWRVKRRMGDTLVVTTEQGVFEVSSHDTVIGRKLFVERGFEVDFMNEALEYLRESGRCPSEGRGTLFDIGANVGVTSIPMLLRGHFARSIAMEPAPETYRLLHSNICRNDLEDRILSLQVAASDADGELEFELSSRNWGDHRVRVGSSDLPVRELNAESDREVIHVQARMIDDILDELPGDFVNDICLVWIDVQGHEGHAFTGASKLLARKIPVVSEICPYALARAGMSVERFQSIAERHWTRFAVLRRKRFVTYPIGILPKFFEELGDDGDFDNVIFLA